MHVAAAAAHRHVSDTGHAMSGPYASAAHAEYRLAHSDTRGRRFARRRERGSAYEPAAIGHSTCPRAMANPEIVSHATGTRLCLQPYSRLTGATPASPQHHSTPQPQTWRLLQVQHCRKLRPLSLLAAAACAAQPCRPAAPADLAIPWPGRAGVECETGRTDFGRGGHLHACGHVTGSAP
eukprot:jgi/Ulvmu1/2146/UM129_0005.1